MNRKDFILILTAMLLSVSGSAFAASESPNAPTLFLDYLFDFSNGYHLSLNPTDLKGKNPFSDLKKGTAVWIGTKEKMVGGKFESVKLNEQWPSQRGGIEVEFMPRTNISTGYTLLSLKQLPDQKWKEVSLENKDASFLRQQIKSGPNSAAFPPVRIHSEVLGDFLLANEELKIEGEFVSFRTILFKHNQQKWEKVSEIVGQGTEVLVDVDGDGFPEVAGGTGYKSFVLKRIYPKVEEIVINTSGV